MIKHTAIFSNGDLVIRNFKKCLPFALQSVNTQINSGNTTVQTLVSFSSKNAAKNLFGKLSGTTVNEVVAVTHSGIRETT